MTTTDECMCEGNWRILVKECEPLFNKIFIDEKDKEYKFIGLLWGDDDFYYSMINLETAQLELISCVLDLESYGFNIKNEN